MHTLNRRDLLAFAGLASLPQLAETEARPAMPMQGPENRRRELYATLGDLPDRKRPIGGKKRNEEQRDGYVLETWDST